MQAWNKSQRRVRRRTQSAAHAARRAITLFEVVLAIAIFVGALAAISEVLRTGSRASVRAQLTSEAAIRCERRMNELVGAVLPLEPADRIPFEDDPNWVYTVTILDGPAMNLLQVETLVERLASTGESSASCRLVRLLRDPQIYYDANLGATGSGL